MVMGRFCFNRPSNVCNM